MGRDGLGSESSPGLLYTLQSMFVCLFLRRYHFMLVSWNIGAGRPLGPLWYPAPSHLSVLVPLSISRVVSILRFLMPRLLCLHGRMTPYSVAAALPSPALSRTQTSATTSYSLTSGKIQSARRPSQLSTLPRKRSSATWLKGTGLMWIRQ